MIHPVIKYILIYELLCVLSSGVSPERQVSRESCGFLLNCKEDLITYYTEITNNQVEVECQAHANFIDKAFFLCVQAIYCFNCGDNNDNRYYSYSYSHDYKYQNVRGVKLTIGHTNYPLPIVLAVDTSWWSMASLKALNISNNNLKNTPNNFFEPFSALTELDLSYNNFTQINNEQFFGLANLERLNLSKNSITSFNNSFQYNFKLAVIDLSYNQIKNLPTNIFESQDHLNKLILNNNKIVHFELNISNVPNFHIKTIDLGYNKLSDIGSLINLTNKLEYLDLTQNNLTSFKANLTSSIRSINLSQNKLKELNEYSMINASNMISVNLSHNLLTSLPTSSFRNQQGLRTLDISNNLLKENNLGAYNNWLTFFFYFDNLENVALDGNLWICADLKDIVFSLKTRSVKLNQGAEHTKSNVLGISCIQQDAPSANLSSSFDISSNVMTKILGEAWNRLENITKATNITGISLANVREKLTDTNLYINDTINNTQAVFKNIFAKIHSLEIQLNNSTIFSQANRSYPHKELLENINTADIFKANETYIMERLEHLETQLNGSTIVIKANQSRILSLLKNLENRLSNDTVRIVDILSRFEHLEKRLNDSATLKESQLNNKSGSVSVANHPSLLSRLENVETLINNSIRFFISNHTFADTPPNKNLNGVSETPFLNWGRQNQTVDSVDNKDELALAKGELELLNKELSMLKSTKQGVWGEILHNLLLTGILAVLLVILYTNVFRKSSISRDEVELVETR